jgi:hypothetical protein
MALSYLSKLASQQSGYSSKTTNLTYLEKLAQKKEDTSLYEKSRQRKINAVKEKVSKLDREKEIKRTEKTNRPDVFNSVVPKFDTNTFVKSRETAKPSEFRYTPGLDNTTLRPLPLGVKPATDKLQSPISFFNKKKIGGDIGVNAINKYTDYLTEGKLPSAVAAGAMQYIQGTNEFGNMIITEFARNRKGDKQGKNDIAKFINAVLPDGTSDAIDGFFDASDKVLSRVINEKTENYMTDSNVAEQRMYQIVSGMVNMLPSIATSMATMGASAIPTFTSNLIGTIPFATSAAGNYKLSAEKEMNMNEKDATLYGAVAGTLEALPQFFSLGLITKVLGKAATPVLTQGAKVLATEALKQTAKKTGSSAVKYGTSYLLDVLKSVGAEAFEEVAINPALKKTESLITGEKFELFGEGGYFDPDEALESAILGGGMALGFAAIGLPGVAFNINSMSKYEKAVKMQELIEKLKEPDTQEKIEKIMQDFRAETRTGAVDTSPTGYNLTEQSKVKLGMQETAQPIEPAVTPSVVAQEGTTATEVNEVNNVKEVNKNKPSDVKYKTSKEVDTAFEKITGEGIERAKLRMAGIEVRNMQRKNGNNKTEVETIPYTEEQLGLIDTYDKLKNPSSKYLFHTTPVANIESIASNGLTTGNKARFEGTSDTSKISLSANEAAANYYGGDNDIMLRVNKKYTPKNLETDLLAGGEGTYNTTENIPSEYLEVKVNNKWIPVSEYVENQTIANTDGLVTPVQTQKLQKNLTELEQMLKDYPTIFGGLIQSDMKKGKALSDFLDVKVKKYRQLLEKMQSKKMTKADIAEVEKLVKIKESIPNIKKEFNQKLTQQRKELRESFNQIKKDIKEANAINLKKEIEAVKYNDEVQKQKEVDKIMRKYWDKVEALEKKIEDNKYKEFWNKELTKQDTKKKLAELKVEVETRMKELQKEKEARQKEREKEREFDNTLLKALKKLASRNKYLRPEFQASSERLLAEFDTKAKSISKKKKLELTSLKNEMVALKENDSTYEIPEEINQKIARLELTSISQMNAELKQDLLDVINHILTENKNTNQLISEKLTKDATEATKEIAKEIGGSPILETKRANRFTGLLDLGSEIFKYGVLGPERVMASMVDWNYDSVLNKSTMGMIIEGQTRELRFIQKASKLFESGFKGIKEKDYTKTKFYKLDNGGITLSQDQVISIYLMSLNEDNKRHAMEGGVRTRERSKTLKLTEKDFNKLEKELTKDDKKVIKVAREFFDVLSKGAINETSLDVLGYYKAMVENYFPIVTDSLYANANSAKFAGNATVESLRALQERTAGAKNPIRLEGVFDVIKRATKDTARYYGYARVNRNVKMVINNQRVTEAVQEKYGHQKPLKVIEDLIKDIEQPNRRELYLGVNVDKLIRNFQTGVLGINVGVAIKQVVSLPIAATELDIKYLAGSLDRKTSKETIDESTPYKWVRDMGFSTKEAGESQDLIGIHTKPSIWTTLIRKGDKIAIDRIWYWTEEQIAKTTNLKDGSKEFYAAVADKFEQVLFRTQPNFTMAQRPAYLRTHNQFIRLSAMFMTQRLQNYGLAYEGLSKLGTAIKTKDGSLAKQSFRLLAPVIVSNIMIGLINSGIRRWRGYDDDLGEAVLATFLGNIYLVGTIYDVLVNGWEVQDVVHQGINDFALAIKGVVTPGNKTTAGSIRALMEATAMLSGKPLKNVLRSFETGLNKIDPYLSYEWANIWKDEPDYKFSPGAQSIKEKFSSIEKKYEKANQNERLTTELVTKYSRLKTANDDLNTLRNTIELIYRSTKSTDEKKKLIDEKLELIDNIVENYK